MDPDAVKFILAPMVIQSELPYRMLCRHFGTTLCYTPMIPAKEYVECKDEEERRTYWKTHEKDRPLGEQSQVCPNACGLYMSLYECILLVVQFWANAPEDLIQAAKLVEDQCDAVDLNLGCPQVCARKANFGSFLLDHPELVHDIVRNCANSDLRIPTFCKIRILPTYEETLQFAMMLQRAGCALLVVHGRRRERIHHDGPADWDVIRSLKENLSIPVVGPHATTN